MTLGEVSLELTNGHLTRLQTLNLSSLDRTLTPRLLGSVPGLSTLRVRLEGDRSLNALDQINARNLTRLRSLTLGNCDLAPYVDVSDEERSFLSSLPALEHLRAEQYSAEHLSDLLSSISTPLRTLELYTYPPAFPGDPQHVDVPLGTALRHAATLPNLRQLTRWAVMIDLAHHARPASDKAWEDDDWHAWLATCEERGVEVKVDLVE